MLEGNNVVNSIQLSKDTLLRWRLDIEQERRRASGRMLFIAMLFAAVVGIGGPLMFFPFRDPIYHLIGFCIALVGLFLCSLWSSLALSTATTCKILLKMIDELIRKL